MAEEFLKVSIITPTFNHEKYISKCIASVLNQSYQNWELIVIDDGSTDSTLQLACQAAGDDSRIRVLTQENCGLLRLDETYNRALKLCEGQLIAILEGDDWWPADKLAIQVQYHQYNANLIMSHGKVIKSDGETIIGEYPKPSYTGSQSSVSYLRMLLLKESCFMPVSVVIDAKSLNSIGGFKRHPGYPAVDLPTFRDLVLISGDVIWIDHILGFWRQSTTQATSTVFTPQVDLINQQISIQTYRDLSDATRSQLHLSESDVYRATQDKIVVPGLMTAFRNSIKQKKRRMSLRLAINIFRYGNVRNRIFAIIGLGALLVNKNIERLYKKDFES